MSSFSVLRIRNAHLEALGRSRKDFFAKRAADHLARYFPHLPELVDRSLLLARVQRSIQKAAGYGFSSQRDLIRWLNVDAALGEDFAGDLRYPWARRILESPLRPSDKANRLSRTALAVIQDLARDGTNEADSSDMPSFDPPASDGHES